MSAWLLEARDRLFGDDGQKQGQRQEADEEEEEAAAKEQENKSTTKQQHNEQPGVDRAQLEKAAAAMHIAVPTEPMWQKPEYLQFRAAVPKQRVCVGRSNKEWTYYAMNLSDGSASSRRAPAVVMLHGTSGTCDMFFHQILELANKGYRVVSAQFPDYWSHVEWVRGFHAFLAELKLRRVHLFGSSLGGFLALHYVRAHPQNVSSLMMCNSFCDTTLYADSAPCIGMFAFMPEFYLKKYILDSFPSRALPPEQADAVDFAVVRLESLTREDLGARLTLNCIRSRVTDVSNFDERKISFIDVQDEVALPDSMRQQLYDTFPKARAVFMKSGGDFPFLSSPDEVTMLMQVHLRSHGLFPTSQTFQKRLKQLDPQSDDHDDHDDGASAQEMESKHDTDDADFDDGLGMIMSTSKPATTAKSSTTAKSAKAETIPSTSTSTSTNLIDDPFD